MKTTLIALLALGGLAMADYSFDPIKEYSYTWGNFSTDPLGGVWKENSTPMTPSTTTTTVGGVSTTALTSYLESRTGSPFIHDAIIAAASNDDKVFTISFDYLYKAENTSWGQAIFHVDQKGKGITIASSGTGLLSVFVGTASGDGDYVTNAEGIGVTQSEAMTLNAWNNVAITFSKEYQTDIYLNGTLIGTANLSNVSWSSNEIMNYCFGEVAPGWASAGQKPFNDSGAMIANVSAIYGAKVPEPTTGALSLLALAGLCIRRRK